MKKLLTLIAIILLIPTSVFGFGSTRFGRMPFLIGIGVLDVGTATSFTIDSAFVFGTSGDSWGATFPGKSQSSASLTVYVYCTAVTGTPNSSTAYIYASASGANDTDRPDAGSSPIATSGVVDASGCGTAGWLTYTFSSVSLSDSNYYWFVLTNTTGTPASNNFSVQSRGSIDSTNFSVNSLRSTTNADGWTTDGTLIAGSAPIVIKFSDGSIIGMPYVSTTAHANNTNFRGARVNFDESVNIGGFLHNVITSTMNSFKIYQGSTEVYSFTTDPYSEAEANIVLFPSTTLTKGVDYDFVLGFASGSTAGPAYCMGNSAPADVLAVNTNFTYVEGATAGSFTESADCVWFGELMINNNPEISTGGGGGSQPIPNISVGQ